MYSRPVQIDLTEVDTDTICKVALSIGAVAGFALGATTHPYNEVLLQCLGPTGVRLLTITIRTVTKTPVGFALTLTGLAIGAAAVIAC